MSDEERAQIWFMNSNPDKSTEVIDWDEGDIISKPVLHDCE